MILTVALAFGQTWLWSSAWSVTLIVWWAYLILSLILLLRLLTMPRSRPRQGAGRTLVWSLIALAALLWWSGPLLLQMGESLVRHLRPLPAATTPAGMLAGR